MLFFAFKEEGCDQMKKFGFKKMDNILEDSISETIREIRPIDPDYSAQAREYNDSLCKPLGSLGRLEEIRERLWAITEGDLAPFKKAVVVYAGDNGVFAEGVSFNPQDITYKVCLNIKAGSSGLGRIAQFYNTQVFLEDLAVLEDVEGHCDYKVRKGTGNIKLGPAMTRSEAAEFILAGVDRTEILIDQGYNLIGAGEMGVGNTTTSAAVISVLTGQDPELTTGFGSGLTRQGFEQKIAVIQESIRVNEPFQDILDLISKLGGADICAMAGTYLACARRKVPFALDGVISLAALAVSYEFSPSVLDYAFPSHKTRENGARAVEEMFDLKPMVDLEMRLGEGSGCPIAMNLMECAVFALGSMASFNDFSVNKEDYIDIREEL